MKLLYIRHDLTPDHWKAIAKIMVSGYIDQHYFPVIFVPIFMYECMLHHYDDAELLSIFWNSYQILRRLFYRKVS